MTIQPAHRFHVVTAVWGGEYLDLFLGICLPLQLSPGNVPTLPAGSRYRILTRAADVETVRVHPAFQELSRRIAVDIVAVNGLEEAGKSRYARMTLCHRHAVLDARREGAALVFVSADTVFSDGAFAAIVRHHRDGKRAVACTGLRLVKETFVEELGAFHASAGRFAAPPPRLLVRMALPHLHDASRALFSDAPAFCRFPTAVYWRIGTRGLLARCFHLHPLMVDPMRRVVPKVHIDGPFLERACPDYDRVHVVADSDEFVVFELSPAARRIFTNGRAGASVWRAAAIAAACDGLQLRFWRTHVRLHADDLDAAWDRVGVESDSFVEDVLRKVRFGRVARRWFRALELCRQRRERYGRALRRRVPRVKQVVRPILLARHRTTKRLYQIRKRAAQVWNT